MPTFRRIGGCFARGLTAGLTLAALIVAPARADDPTREKCTCDLVSSSPPDCGAMAINAAACWTTEYVDREWCDITISYLDGDSRKRDLVTRLTDSQDAGEISALISDEFRYVVASYGALGGTPFPGEFTFAVDQVGALMKEFEAELSACIAYFAGPKPFKGSDIRERPFACTVGDAAGWLNVAFRIEGVLFTFRIAPNAAQ